jgi:uncharacterized protein (TIGR02600 family)
VIVLTFLVVITGLVVAFLSSVTNEATATSASAAAVTTRSLADAAIQLDIAQIRDATVGFSHNADGSFNSNNPVCWASQPGAIRTYDVRASNVATYKLYSSTNMVDTNGNNPTNDLPASGSWVSKTSLYTDLNAPVVSGGNTNYPVMDPYMTSAVNGSPIVDGFSINTNASAVSGVSNPAAMPVVWLYMLKNGALIQPDSGSSRTATFANASTNPSASNPIVGRIAFWTDDETCKLNINTASEGSFWGTPSATTLMDVSMALTPPVNREYNRYPGHPASTSLSPVLWSYFGLSNPSSFAGFLPGNPGNGFYFTNRISGNTLPSTTITSFYTNLFANLTPRYIWGGSASGISNTLQGSNPIYFTNLPTGRLYSSVDEMFYAATNPAGQTNGRAVNPFITNSSGGGSVTSPRQIGALRFFLTAVSRAPEVNPMNLPKLCLWPVPDANHTMTANPQSTSASATRTLADQTIAFCSTLGTNGYYFTRYDATDTGNDITTAGAVSGRNQKLYNYFRNQLNATVPGYQGSFAGGGSGAKWNTLQADQICTLVFDYIRSCINLVDAGSLDVNQMTNSSKPYQYSYTAPPTNTVGSSLQGGVTGNTTNATLTSGTGQVVPIVITNPGGNVTKGIGRFPTINRGILWFVARGADQPPLMVHPDHKPIVYLANGTQISTNMAGISSIITNYMSNVLLGQTYAQINPMHPWTCPQTSSVTIGGLPTVTQLIVGTNPVLADSSSPTAPPARHFTNTTDCSAVYPIFNLITNNLRINTRTYPTINMSNSWIYSTNVTASNSFSMVDPFPDGLHSGRGIYCYYVPRGMRHLCGGGGGGGGTNTNPPIYYYMATLGGTNASANITHGGLPYLTIQNPKTGGFDMLNSNYKDTLTPALTPHQTRMEVLFLPSLANVTPGAIGYCPNFKCTVSNLSSFTVNSTNNMGFPGSSSLVMNSGISGWNGSALDLNSYGLGAGAFNNAMGSGTSIKFYATNFPVVSATAPTGERNGATFSFGGGVVTIALATTNDNAIQSLSMNFPNAVFPTPKLPPYVNSTNFPPNLTFSTNLYTNSQGAVGPVYNEYLAAHDFLTFNQSSTAPSGINNANYGLWSNIANSLNEGSGNSVMAFWGQGANNSPSYFILPEAGTAGTTNAYNAPWFNAGYKYAISYTLESVEALYGDLRLFSALKTVTTNFFTPNPYYGYSNSVQVNGWPMYVRNGFSMQEKSTYVNGGTAGTLLPLDAAASLNNWTYLGTTLQGFNTNFYMASNPLVSVPSGNDSQKIFMTASSAWSLPLPFTVPTCDFKNPTFSSIWKQGGDFDNGFGFFPDGPFIGKVDEGYGMYGTNWTYGQYFLPYFSALYSPSGKTLQSPNRMVPSSMVFGSLPVGFAQMGSASSPSNNMLTNSWLTLQFSPNPNSPSTNFLSARNAAAGFNEAGGAVTNTIPPDHLILDFFQMPVIEPYPISDPFSTAGKVNMNYQIAPFNYINRDSAMRGVLKSVMITAIDENYAGMYKFSGNGSSFNTSTYPSGTSYNQLASNSGNFYFYYPINASNTLAQFTNRFGNNDLFHSPSEICSLWLYPSCQPSSSSPANNVLPLTNSTGTSITYTNGNTMIKSWWYDAAGTTRKGITGDNLRERPYGYLYPRLTTKSNTYQIHYRVQTLKQTRTAHSSDWATWIDPSAGGISDKILGEQRGSAVIERFIDPSDPSLPDFSANVSQSSITGPTLDQFYQFRVFNAKQFTP